MTEKHKVVQVEGKIYVGLKIVYTQKLQKSEMHCHFPLFSHI